jgi:hypothetical protein
MNKARKTVSIDFLKETANAYLLHSADDFVSQRMGVASLLEQCLHETNNYSGFRYLEKRDLVSSENGFSVGINTNDDDNYVKEDYTERFKNTDSSRVRYF